MPKIAVILPAAGKSTRFGGREKKPFVSLDGRPIWLRAAELFFSRDDVERVYLVLAPGDIGDFRERFGHLIAFADIEIVPGGEERFDSVGRALERIGEAVDFVAVHDAVRPLASTTLIHSVIAGATQSGAAMPAIPVADTLKRVDPTTHRVMATISRAGLWQAQTPQIFRRDWLVEAYAKRISLDVPVTDDAQLLEAIGHPVTIVPGSPVNFKITTAEDLELAEAILHSRQKTKSHKPAAAFGDEAQW